MIAFAIGRCRIEQLLVIYATNKLAVVAAELRRTGSRSEAGLPIPSILRRAVSSGASRLVLAHNHPSGDPQPSAIDLRASRHLARAGRQLETLLLDHIIVGGHAWTSMRQDGLL